MRYWVFLILLLLDASSKAWAAGSIPPIAPGGFPYGGISIFPSFFGVSFSLNYVVNTGAAWGIFPNYPGLLFGFRLAMIAGLVWYFYRLRQNHRLQWALGLIITGALGNVFDYLWYGHVVDFFHFCFWGYSFPIFNFADSYITIGVFLLLLFEYFKPCSESA